MTRDQFLEKYLTVVGKHTAIVGKDEAFIKKYLTQVGCPVDSVSEEEDIKTVADSGSDSDTEPNTTEEV